MGTLSLPSGTGKGRKKKQRGGRRDRPTPSSTLPLSIPPPPSKPDVRDISTLPHSSLSHALPPRARYSIYY